MKRMLIVCAIFLLSITNVFAQTSISTFVRFPDNKLAGRSYKPMLAFARVDDVTYLALKMIHPYNYNSFDSESRILIRFEDETVIKLPIHYEFGVFKNFDTSWNSSLNRFSDFYITDTLYDIPMGDITKLTSCKIVKIRVVQTNGDIDDYPIGEIYQNKLLIGLKESYQELMYLDRQRKVNNMDETF